MCTTVFAKQHTSQLINISRSVDGFNQADEWAFTEITVV